MTMSLRPAAILAPASFVAFVFALIGCSQLQPMPADPLGRLFARGLDQIDELYIVDVSNRKLALEGATRLAQLDPKLKVVETPGPHDETEIVLTQGERDVAAYRSPMTDDPHVWGGWLGQVEADAKQASPVLAAHSQDEIDKAVFDGIASGLDRFSHYATPEAARDQRAARDGFGGVACCSKMTPTRSESAKSCMAVRPMSPGSRSATTLSRSTANPRPAARRTT